MTRPRVLFALLTLLAGVGGCLSFNDNNNPDVRALDSLCGDAGTCRTTGSARRTTGPTADTVGYKLGPGAGALYIPLDQYATGGGVLARGNGWLDVSVPGCSQCQVTPYKVQADAQWIDLSSLGTGSVPDSVELSVENDGSRVDIVDLNQSTASCSIAPAGPR